MRSKWGSFDTAPRIESVSGRSTSDSIWSSQDCGRRLVRLRGRNEASYNTEFLILPLLTVSFVFALRGITPHSPAK